MGRNRTPRICTKLIIVIHHRVPFLNLLLVDHFDRLGFNFVGHAVSVDPFGKELVPELH